MPIMGKGDPIIIYEDSDEEYNEYMRKKSKKKGDDSKGETQPRYSRDKPRSWADDDSKGGGRSDSERFWSEPALKPLATAP